MQQPVTRPTLRMWQYLRNGARQTRSLLGLHFTSRKYHMAHRFVLFLTLRAICRLPPGFSNAIRWTFVRNVTRFSLTQRVARSLGASWATYRISLDYNHCILYFATCKWPLALYCLINWLTDWGCAIYKLTFYIILHYITIASFQSLALDNSGAGWKLTRSNLREPSVLRTYLTELSYNPNRSYYRLSNTVTQQWFFQFCRQVSRSLTAVTVITTIVTIARGVRRILVRGVNAPCHLTSHHSYHFTPTPIQKTDSFCMFSLYNFSSIFPGGSADPIWPYVRTPMTITVQWSQKQLQEDREIDKTQLKSKINTSKALCNTDGQLYSCQLPTDT